MADVKVYSTDHCGFCMAAKRLLKSLEIDFEEINLSSDPQELRSLKERTGMMTVPQIFINDRFIGGYRELADLKEKGELEKLLG